MKRRPAAQRVQLTGEELELARERVRPRLALDGVGRWRRRGWRSVSRSRRHYKERPREGIAEGSAVIPR